MKNRKRLNNKGFTLIELLAVIVILAIVMGISATNVLNSINNSRSSSLYSAAQNAANTLNTWVSEDMLVTDNTKKKLGDQFVSDTQTSSTWICLNDTKLVIMNGKGTANTKLTDALSLGNTDVDLNFSGTPPTTGTAPTQATCSALRYNDSTGGYEFLLVAHNGGKYYVSKLGDSNYAFSRATKSGENIND